VNLQDSAEWFANLGNLRSVMVTFHLQSKDPGKRMYLLTGQEAAMFEEVKIFSAKGRLKKIITSKESSKQYWDAYFNSQGKENSRIQIKSGRKRVNPLEYPDDVSEYWEDQGL